MPEPMFGAGEAINADTARVYLRKVDDPAVNDGGWCSWCGGGLFGEAFGGLWVVAGGAVAR